MAPDEPRVERLLAEALARSAAGRHGIYLGEAGGALFAPPEHAALVLGPPRSGKTSAIVVPNVLMADGPVVAVSTKVDVLALTRNPRSRLGPCYLFDPSGAAELPPGVARVGWSPTTGAERFEQAVATAEAMVGASRGSARGDAVHWNERAGALLSTLLHAAALTGAAMDDVVSAVNRHEISRFLSALSSSGSPLATDLLAGIEETDPREKSGIFSTTSGVLAAYRTQSALDSASAPPLDVGAFLAGRATLYVTASSQEQHQVAPLVAGLVQHVKSAAFERARAGLAAAPAPVLMVLDELANIAPLRDLPTLVAEGGSQGVVTLACLQDLAQARERWGEVAEGFWSLFGAKVVLPGVGDTRTLEALSLVAGETEVERITTTAGHGRRATTRARSIEKVSVLPPSAIAAPPPGRAVVAIGGRVGTVALTPAHRTHPFDALIAQPTRDAPRRFSADLGRAWTIAR